MKKNHFREINSRICGNLNIDEALYDAFIYLRQVLPLDAIFLTINEPQHKRTRIVAVAIRDRGYLLDEVVQFSDDVFNQFQERGRLMIGSAPRFRNQSEPIYLEVLKFARRSIPSIREFAVKGFSAITCSLDVKREVNGNVTFGAIGKDRYKEEHRSLANEISEPFAIALSNTLRYLDLVRDHQALQKDTRRMSGNVMIGADSGLREVRELLEYVAPTETTVLLLGATGTGKEVVANEIHKLSGRSKAPLITLNCGAIPDSLIDSELFGHEKGSFTGAIETTRGRFERADKGILFLDEIGELSLTAQTKLLRVLQNGEFERVGGGKKLKANVRIIAATHRDLTQLVNDGLFRQDLWYRLNIFPIKIPSLKDRKQDIPALADYFVQAKHKELNLPLPPKLSQSDLEQLMSYDWPGNIRELQNVVERALIISRGQTLYFHDLISEEKPKGHLPDVKIKKLQSMEEAMSDHTKYVLSQVNGQIAGLGGAAEILKMHPSTLRSRMKKLGISFTTDNTS